MITAGVLACFIASAVAQSDPPPNVVIVFADDLGYGDTGIYDRPDPNAFAGLAGLGGAPGGAPANPRGYATPNIDRLAIEGVRLTQFYTAQAVCSASRAALLTGCYPNRIGILGALNHLADTGIADEETTLAELFRSKGYATLAVGKWHLGHHPQFLPTRHGFDEYFGLPYSNDMSRHHPTDASKYPPLPLYDGEKIVANDPDQSLLTKHYADRTVAFIERQAKAGKPFFAYFASTMPHVPLFASAEYRGKSPRGIYGDVVSELDGAVGRILETLKRNRLDRNTLVIFTSDNGPWLSYGDHAGTTGGLRAGKGTAFEGGVRVPFAARWPDHLPAGRSIDVPAMTIDVLPTLAAILKAELPARKIDGINLFDTLKGSVTPPNRAALFFYWGRDLHAVRMGEWKLHLPHPYRRVEVPGSGGKPGREVVDKIELSLFDLVNDPAEAENVGFANREAVAQMLVLIEAISNDLGDGLTKRVGKGARAPGRFAREAPKP